MSATSQLTTFSDIYTDLQQRVRATTGVTATENQAKRYINISLQDMHLGTDYKLPWAERQAVLLTHARYSTGTVSIALATRTTVTGDGTAWATAVTGMGFNNARAGGKMTFAGSQNVYRVNTVTNDTSITLDSRYVGTAALSGATYLYFEDEYALASDFLRLVDVTSFDLNQEIRVYPRGEFYRRYPRNTVTGKPRAATLIDRPPSGSTVPVRRVVLAPHPDQLYVISYRYITANLAVSALGVEATSLSADTDEPLVPLRYRHAILYHALYNWYRDKKDDARSQEVWGQYVDIMQRIVADVEVGARQPSLRPDLGQYAASVYRPYRQTGTRRKYDITGAFDYEQ